MRRINYSINLICIFIIFFLITGCSDDGGSADKPPLNTDVIMIGDSYFDLGDEYIRTNLENLSGERYRHYYKNGAQVTPSTAEVSSIPQQYDNAQSENSNITTVIMDGGGNDILTEGGGWDQTKNVCSDAPLNTECRTLIDDTMDAVEALVNEMKNDSVTNIIYMFYPHLTDNMAWINEALDYAFNQAELLCTESENCHLIDPRDEFEDHTEYFLFDNVHPNEDGGEVLANLIWQVMVNNNIEQN